MASKFPHYIWQNPSACARIYPNRIPKLREFLLVYKEADLMAEHADLEKNERKVLVKKELGAYKEELEALGDDQQPLLAKVLEYLDYSPRGFKPWVKYAIVHFSGMRYESAYDSWAEPRALLNILLKRKLLPQSLLGDNSADSLTDEQALAALKELRPGGSAQAPEWAWLVIVLHTPLRTAYITQSNVYILDKNGQQNIPGYHEALQSGNPYGRAIQEWLPLARASWREKQLADFSLVVLRAVCNEVSEHVHHIRLQVKAGGGLSGRPPWYLAFERADDPKAPGNVGLKKPKGKGKPKAQNVLDFSDEILLGLPEGERAYLRRPLNEQFFKPGASMLWLRWVPSQPAEWQMTFPLRGYNFNRADPSEKTWKYGTCVVTTEGGKRPTVIRTEIKDKEKPKNKENKGEKGKKGKEGKKPQPESNDKVEWLRWMHEAVVLDIVDLLDGRTVLTFETGPVAGLNQRSLTGLCHPGGGTPHWSIFVGYAGDKPLDPLHQEFLAAMMDSDLLSASETIPPAPEGLFALTEEIVGVDNIKRLQAQYKGLTPRQRQVVALYCQGLSKKQIARRMDIPQAKVADLMQTAADRVGLHDPQTLPLYFNGIDFGKWNVLKESSY